MKIKLFPIGYDPMVAYSSGQNWTKEDTKRALELAEKAEIVEVCSPPIGRWYEKID